MFIKTNKANIWWELENVVYYGQSGDDIICETTETPCFDFQEVNEEYSNFKQGCVKPKIVSQSPTIAELKSIYQRIQAVGEKGEQANDLFALGVLEELKEKETEIDALALTILSLMEV